ncbi:uncharacterized protein LOC119729953 [Patiria miniata]|uniref:Integrase catalytic domain-containing protein n=1 Tax=Patiria miniata TaxID=46514 RepID=A0A914A4B5_PATMI|nr:uncharacterized protein LOC119729953 [Patiria miniata]
MELLNTDMMEEEIAILRMDNQRGEELLQDAIEERQRLKDELEKIKGELLESTQRGLEMTPGIKTPELFSLTPRLSPLGTVPATPANTMATSVREECTLETTKKDGPAGTVLKEKNTSEPVKEDVAETEIKLKKPNICPDRFNGKVPWKDYKAHFMACRVANGWNDGQAKVFLAASLQGPALSVLGCQPEGKKYSFRDLISSLDQRFGPGQQAEYHLMELRHRRQGEKETLQELGQSIRELSALAYPEFSEEGRDRLARGHFMDSVGNRAIREAIFRAKPTSLDDSIKASLAAESYHKVEEQRAADKTKKYARMVETEPTVEATGEVPVNQAVVDRAVQQIISRLGENVPTGSKDTIRPFGRRKANTEDVCHNCRCKGHFARDCKKPKARRSRMSDKRHAAISGTRERAGRSQGSDKFKGGHLQRGGGSVKTHQVPLESDRQLRGEETLKESPLSCGRGGLPTLEVPTLRETLRQGSGLFVPAVVRGVKVNMLIDTGATNTLLSASTYYNMSPERRPTLNTEGVGVHGADGTLIKTMGSACVEVQVGKTVRVVCVVFAQLEVEGILGMDYLLPTNGRLDFRNLTFTVNGERIKCVDRHRAGESHQNADSLSHRPRSRCGRDEISCDEDEGKSVERSVVMDTSDQDAEVRADLRVVGVQPQISKEGWRRAQLEDEQMNWLIQAKEEAGTRPDWEIVSPKSTAAKNYWLQWEQLTVRQGILQRRWESHDGREVHWQTVVPQEYREEILREMHAVRTSGHLGTKRTMTKVRLKFHWSGLSADVRSFIRRCDLCAARKLPSKKQNAPLQQHLFGVPVERVAMDICGPFPVTTSGNRYILVIGDYFSKWFEAYPIPDEKAVTVAVRFVEEFVCRFGVPRTLHTDQGRNFEANLLAEVCKILGVEKTRTTPYNPKSDGMVERFNRTLVNIVAIMMKDQGNKKDWDRELPFATAAYRSTPQESTGETPNMVMLGREVSLPIDLTIGEPSAEEETQDLDYAQEMRMRMQRSHDRARKCLAKSARRQKRHYDRNVCKEQFVEGKFCWLFNPAKKKGVSPKLMCRWEGPYLILDKLSDVTYRIQGKSGEKMKVVHSDRLKPYEGKPLKPWAKRRSSSQEEDNQVSPETQLQEISEVSQGSDQETQASPEVESLEEANLPETEELAGADEQMGSKESIQENLTPEAHVEHVQPSVPTRTEIAPAPVVQSPARARKNPLRQRRPPQRYR